MTGMCEAEICMNPTKPETQVLYRTDNFKLIGAGAIALIALAAFYLSSPGTRCWCG